MSYPTYDLTLQQIGTQAYATNKKNGFLGTDFPSHIALMHSELSEAFESYRKGEDVFFLGEGGKPEGVASELADVVIRICSFCHEHGISLEAAVSMKMKFNETRPFKHGGKKF